MLKTFDKIGLCILIIVGIVAVCLLFGVGNNILPQPLELSDLDPNPNPMSIKDKRHQSLIVEGITHSEQHYETPSEFIKSYLNRPKYAKHEHRIVTLNGTVELIALKKVEGKADQSVIQLKTDNPNDINVKVYVDRQSEYKASEFKKGSHIFILGVACDVRDKEKKDRIEVMHMLRSMIDHKAPR